MTFTPFVGPLAQALGGDREGALLLMWLLYHQDRAGGACVLTSAQAERDLAIPRSTLYRVRARLEERGLVRSHRDAQAGGTRYEVSVRRVSALMGWATMGHEVGPKRANGWAKTGQPSALTPQDASAFPGPKMERFNKDDYPLPPAGAEPIGSWAERLTTIADPDHRCVVGAWLDTYERRTDGGLIRGARGGGGFFGDDGLFAVRDELLALYAESPEPLLAVLPGFWERWDGHRRGRNRGTRRLLAFLRDCMVDAGHQAPVDRLMQSLINKP